jgi:hypothetical protein
VVSHHAVGEVLFSFTLSRQRAKDIDNSGVMSSFHLELKICFN